MYKDTPNISHNPDPESVLLSGENHHPELDSLTFGEDPKELPLEPSDSDGSTTLRDDTSDLSSSTSPTSGRYAQSDPPPEMMTDCLEEEERGEIKDELVSPEAQGMRGGSLLEEEEPPDPAPPAKASPDCPSDTLEDLHPNSTDLHPKRNDRKVVAVAHKAVSDGPTWNSIRCAYPTANSQLITSNSATFFSSSAKQCSKNANLLFNWYTKCPKLANLVSGS